LTVDLYYYHNVVIMLGEFEYLILTAATRLGEDAYGAAIRREVENATGSACSIGALYTTLDRLEAKGFIKTWMGDATPQRGGRAKRMVQVTANGVRAATEFYAAVTQVSQGVSWTTSRGKTR
jgi:PadR family transcriptional regulator, regulatory protein PadR